MIRIQKAKKQLMKLKQGRDWVQSLAATFGKVSHGIKFTPRTTIRSKYAIWNWIIFGLVR
jgi:hypothetical protein